MQRPHRSQSQSRTIFDPASDAIVGIDTRGQIVFMNKGVEDLFQYSKTELLGQPVEILSPVRFRGKQGEPFQWNSPTVWKSSMNTGWEFHARRKNGTEFPADVVADMLETNHGTITLAIFRDLPKVKQMDDQLHQAQKMEALGRLAGVIAHDFNNFLSVMLGYVEMAIKSPSFKGPIRQSLEEIQKAGAAAASLTNQLLLFGRKQIQNPAVVNLNQVVSEMEGFLQQLVGEDIELAVRKDPSLGTVKADFTEAKQVIMNLAANARDAMPCGGKLVIETANAEVHDADNISSSEVPPGRYVSLKVTDSGRGINEKIRSHLFEPFYTTKKEGTGLGLSTVYGIVKNSGGHIFVDSAPRAGTTFAIYLPQFNAHNSEIDTALKPTVDKMPIKGNGTILVAEDNEALRKLVCKYLRGRGYNVLDVKDGVGALRKAKRHPGPIHLLLSDVVMPIISGPELAMRLNEQRPEMKVLFISGYAEDVVRNRSIVYGKVKVLKKPFSLEMLARNVSEMLEVCPVSDGSGSKNTEG